MTKVVISRSFYEKADRIPEEIQGEVEERLFAISRDVAHYSPVDTGAFVNSWGVSTSPVTRRGFSSHNRPKALVKSSEKAKGLTNMTNDIIATRTRADLQASAGTYYFTNGAPHAGPVEKQAAIFAIIRRKHG
jgi:hypothetical protein